MHLRDYSWSQIRLTIGLEDGLWHQCRRHGSGEKRRQKSLITKSRLEGTTKDTENTPPSGSFAIHLSYHRFKHSYQFNRFMNCYHVRFASLHCLTVLSCEEPHPGHTLCPSFHAFFDCSVLFPTHHPSPVRMIVSKPFQERPSLLGQISLLLVGRLL